jgi:predicted SprT family Zn-dependent metalloprotease
MVSQDIQDLIDYLCSEHSVPDLHIKWFNHKSAIASMSYYGKTLGINSTLFNEYPERQQYAIILHEFTHYIDTRKRGYSRHDRYFGILERIMYREFGLKRERDKKTNRYRYAKMQEVSCIKE